MWGASGRAIFLHSAFRSGGTWFWHRFRQCRGTYAYCEPLNAHLDGLTATNIGDYRPASWASGHPDGIGAYYAEYAPLLGQDGGVALYEPRFGIETYFQVDADPGLERYIGMLIDYGHQVRKLPVLGLSCTLGRVAWFRRCFDGVNIVTWRNPRDQWMSSHRQWLDHAHYNFEVHYLLVAYLGRLMAPHADFFEGLPPIPSPDRIMPSMPLFAERDGVADRFRIFLRVFMYDTLLSIEHADAAVDMEQLSGSPAYRADTTARLRDICGLPGLSFEDCNLPRHDFSDDADYGALLAEGLAFLGAFAATPHARAYPKSLPFLRARLVQPLATEGKKG